MHILWRFCPFCSSSGLSYPFYSFLSFPYLFSVLLIFRTLYRSDSVCSFTFPTYSFSNRELFFNFVFMLLFCFCTYRYFSLFNHPRSLSLSLFFMDKIIRPSSFLFSHCRFPSFLSPLPLLSPFSPPPPPLFLRPFLLASSGSDIIFLSLLCLDVFERKLGLSRGARDQSYQASRIHCFCSRTLITAQFLPV